MELETMQYFGLTKELDKADYFEADYYKKMFDNVKFAIKSGGIIALTGIVGIGKSVTLKHFQQAISNENKVLVSKSLVTEKRKVTINTLFTALFTDLAKKKDGKLPTQPEKRERKLQAMIKDLDKPVALFIDEAHSLHPHTLVGLKNLIELVQDVHGTLAVVIVGHPKLANDLRNPALEEIGARAKLFELNPLNKSGTKFIEWLLRNCSKDKIKPHDILTKEAIELFVDKLITPLQVIHYIARALEKGYQLGEKPVSSATAKSVLSPNLDTLEPNLARYGYNVMVLSNCLNISRREINSYLRGQLAPSRIEEIDKEVRKLGVTI